MYQKKMTIYNKSLVFVNWQGPYDPAPPILFPAPIAAI